MTRSVQIRANTSTENLVSLLQANRNGRAVGIYSICSANPRVLEASIEQAKHDASLLLIESTSNQVNQFGGYTGQTPADFARFVRELAEAAHFPVERVILGGDHLGPHVWRKEPAAGAMEKARVLIRDSVLAGYAKIHLDTSMRCADDPGDRHGPLADEIVSARAAELCEIAERASCELGQAAYSPLYVIGTEVPIPGGELSGGQAPEVTKTDALEQTLAVAKRAFQARGLESAWERVIAVVVQPGVEFADSSVFSYDAGKAADLSRFALQRWHGVYEAHSTDYQSAAALRRMVGDHFAILKVGPWLTFAFREAVFALAALEEEWLANRHGLALSRVREQLDRAMMENPVFWKDYYHGNAAELALARKFSYSDRSRYYWPVPYVASAVNRLIENLTAAPPPDTLLSQFLPRQSALVSNGQLAPAPEDLIRSKIREVLEVYASACGRNDGAAHAQ
jgi:D-tagatose-1,6-bisphosphate aldolase subunit GatZ/KbaZ